jgi:NADPH-dependent ferric siderophore reductase
MPIYRDRIAKGPLVRNRLLEAFFIRTTISTVTTTGRFRHLRLHAPQLTGISWTPGQQIRVDCGPATARTPLLRTYSVWDHDQDWIELYCLIHGNSPGSAWASQAAPGLHALITRPKGNFITSPAACHLFAGDETAAAAFGPMIRALPAEVPVRALIETASPADQLPLTRDATWITRPPGAPPADQSGLLAAITTLQLDGPPGAAYLAGEARTIQALRTELVTRHGWPRRAIRTKPFWTPGKRGLE